MEKSDRTNPEIRARIYQSARQALESGLSKQGVTDGQVIALQRQRLELKIREIEGEERSHAHPVNPPPTREAAQPQAAKPAPQPEPAAADAFLLGGALRGEAVDMQPAQTSDLSNLDSLRAERDERPGQTPPPAEEPTKAKGKRRRRGRDAAILDAPPERSAKPRRRRGFLSVLVAWLVLFGLLGLATWWAYSSGFIQQSLQSAMEAAEQASSAPASGQTGLGPQVGFSEEWIRVFNGTNAAVVQASPPATLEPIETASGPALRLASAAGAATADIAIEVPAELLQQLAGRTSTIALTVQSGADTGAEFSVLCDFGGLGTCARHRFTAHQEKADALFRVTFADTVTGNAAGRLVLSTSIAGESNPVLLYAVRILPGQ
ncbi:type IV pilus modification PilV family protein [Pseudorhizobium tarimense]|uniref:type IV pilus modification PilV family protein n=1 Tax=Pseudorhizobium tarimense TaxID=1079109 RepID=UPI001FF1D087|nr:hypothetical protein [Pseudorhizobium tarimense]MCJ8521641.1 hypothetical protein [Pseudorhizobium tarimense]